MKKTLLSITAVLAALTVFFAACQSPVTNPDSLKTSEEISAVSGPEWVKATAYRGAIFVSWAFSKDAKTYTVYRQRSDGLDALVRVKTPTLGDGQSTSGNETESVLDIVSPTNQLVDGVEYTYYVTTNSGQGLTGRAVIGGTTGVTEASTLIQDGATKTTVKANIPARYNEEGVWQDVSVLLNAREDQVLDADAIKEEKVTTTANAEELLLSWPHYNPALNYTVAYDIGKTLTLNTSIPTTSLSLDPDKALGTYAFYGAPLFGGENTARILVTLAKSSYLGPTDPANGEYYYKPLVITKALPSYSRDVLPNPTIGTSSSRTATTAKIVWTAVPGAPNYSDYKLYRIESPNVTTGAYTTGQITVIGDWTPVAIGASTSQTTSSGTTTITVQDTGLTPSKGYVYALYAEVGTAKSVPYLYGFAAETVPAVSTLDIQTTYDLDSTTSVRTYKVVIGWNKVEGHTGYTLERAEVTKYPVAKIGNFTVVSASPAEDGSGRYTVVDTPAIRKSWKYRLTAKDADNITRLLEVDLDDDPFVDEVDSSLAVNATSIDYAYATQVVIGAPSTYTTDLFAEIYRAEAPENTSGVTTPGFITDASEGAVFTKIATESLKDIGSSLSYLDRDPSLIIGKNYIYRHVIKVGTAATSAVEIHNKNTNIAGKTGYVQTASVPSDFNISAANSPSSGTTTRRYYTVTGGLGPNPVNAQGAIVKVQSRISSPVGSWGDYSLQGSVSQYSSDATANLEWSTQDTGVSPGDYHFFISLTGTAPANTDFRLVLIDADGNTTGTTVLLPSFSTW